MLPRQRLNPIRHLLERSLVLRRRGRLTLHRLPVVPLNLRRRQLDPDVEAVDVRLWVRGEAAELVEAAEELVEVAPVCGRNC